MSIWKNPQLIFSSRRARRQINSLPFLEHQLPRFKIQLLDKLDYRCKGTTIHRFYFLQLPYSGPCSRFLGARLQHRVYTKAYLFVDYPRNLRDQVPPKESQLNYLICLPSLCTRIFLYGLWEHWAISIITTTLSHSHSSYIWGKTISSILPVVQIAKISSNNLKVYMA